MIHSFKPTDAGGRCSKCNLHIGDFLKIVVSDISRACSGKNIFSCCGNSGISMWNYDKGQFECAECKTPTSTDPSYNKYPGAGGTQYQWNKKKCECGGEKANTTHAFYCPLWVKY